MQSNWGRKKAFTKTVVGMFSVHSILAVAALAAGFVEGSTVSQWIISRYALCRHRRGGSRHTQVSQVPGSCVSAPVAVLLLARSLG